MSRLRINKEKKAQSVPLSLMPKHVLMLEALEAHFRKNRSKVVQKLIEEAYTSTIGTTHGEERANAMTGCSDDKEDPSTILEELADE